MAKKKREHVLFDRMDRVKNTINFKSKNATSTRFQNNDRTGIVNVNSRMKRSEDK